MRGRSRRHTQALLEACGGDDDDGASNDEDATGTTTPTRDDDAAAAAATRGGEGFTGADLSSALDHIALDRLQAIMESFEVSRGVEVMGTMRQVVVVSAGLDTRAFRVPWPRGTAVFELAGADAHAEAHAAMRRVGAKPPRGCSHRRVRCDPTSWAANPENTPGDAGDGLELEEAMTRAGYAPDVPSVWVVQDSGRMRGDAWARLVEEMADLMCAGSEVVGHVPAASVGDGNGDGDGDGGGDGFGAAAVRDLAAAGVRARCHRVAALGFGEPAPEAEQHGVFIGVKRRPSKREQDYFLDQVYLIENELGDEEGFED